MNPYPTPALPAAPVRSRAHGAVAARLGFSLPQSLVGGPARFVAGRPASDDIAKPGVTEGGYDRIPTRAFHSLRSLWGLTLSELPKVTQPLLVFTSPQDHVVEPANSDAVLDGVSSRVKEQRLLPRSYHVATLDYDADRIFAGSLSFVRELSRAAEAS